METYPIFRDGRPAGSLQRRQEGLYTVFEAALPPREGLTRLYVCGAGARFCLGVMEPRPEGLRMRRRFSRAELRRLPEPIEYAAAEETPPPPRRLKTQNSPAPPLLLTLDGVRYLALPCALRRSPPGLRLYSLAGRQYLLFRT